MGGGWGGIGGWGGAGILLALISVADPEEAWAAARVVGGTISSVHFDATPEKRAGKKKKEKKRVLSLAPKTHTPSSKLGLHNNREQLRLHGTHTHTNARAQGSLYIYI